MKRSAQSPRKPSNLAGPIHQKLNLYALAAGATGVAMLAAAKPAAAEVVFTPASHLLRTNQSVVLDLNRDGIGDFLVSNHAFCEDICGRTLRVLPMVKSNQVEGMKSIFILQFASALAPGAKIGPSANFSGKLMWVSGTEYGYGGNWDNVTDKYLGLKFSINGETHYGWARFSVTVHSQSQIVFASLSGFAYETVPNRPITAGKVKGPEQAEQDGPAPKAATVGLLALGAQGLDMWRREDHKLPLSE